MTGRAQVGPAQNDLRGGVADWSRSSRTLSPAPLTVPGFLDAHAAAADHLMPVNRIKPQTAFHGPIERRCTKMAVVEFGRHPGAAQVHSRTPVEMRDRLLPGIEALRKAGRLLGGVASVESRAGRSSPSAS
jgi:hypothetical protein